MKLADELFQLVQAILEPFQVALGTLDSGYQALVLRACAVVSIDSSCFRNKSVAELAGEITDQTLGILRENA